METHEQRVELHLHTTYSAMDALTSVRAAVERAAAWGHPAIAITDHGSAQAFPEAQRAAKQYGVKVIYGLDGGFRNDVDGEAPEEVYPITLLVKNKAGLQNLYTLISQSYLHRSSPDPVLSKSLLSRHREGLLVGSGGEDGEVSRALLRHQHDEKAAQLAAFYDYLEIQSLSGRSVSPKSDCAEDDGAANLHLRMAALAKRTGKPLAATGNVRFLDPEDETAYSVLRFAQGIEDAGAPRPLYFKSTAEMLDDFSYLGEAEAYRAVVTVPCMLAAQCEAVEPLPTGACLPVIDGADREIREKCTARAEEIYGKPLPAAVAEGLSWELAAMEKHDHTAPFAIASHLVHHAADAGYPVGSRGCVAASLSAYLLGISEINPLPPHYLCSACRHSEFVTGNAYDIGADLPDKVCPVCGAPMGKGGFRIPANTLFGGDGSRLPDIDLNFADACRDEAAQCLASLMGREQILRAGTIDTVSLSLAQSYVSRYAPEMTDAEAEATAEKLMGVKHATNQLPSGFVIIPKGKRAEDFCPVQYGDNSEEKAFPITHFEFHNMDDCLLKMDILTHDAPTLLHQLQALTGVEAKNIPLDDRQTLSLYHSAETADLPEFSGSFSRRILHAVQPNSLSQLIRVSALSHGTGTWTDNAAQLIKSGTATIREVISSRDDVFYYLLGKGMPEGDAYRFMENTRKGAYHAGRMGSDWMDELRRYGVPDWYMDSMRKIAYLFPRAHVAAYTLQSYKVAWFKVHAPEAFAKVLGRR